MVHPNSLGNLSKPGYTNNPNGKPKEHNSWAGILRRIGDSHKVSVTLTNAEGKEQTFHAKAKEGTIKEAASALLWASALKGNLKAFEMIMERIEGKVAQSVKLELPQGKNGKIDLSKLQKPEIEQLKALLKKAHGDKE